MKEGSKSHLVEAFTSSESFDSLVDRQFRGKPHHRAEDAGPFAIPEMVADLGDKLLRSRQEYVMAPSGLSSVSLWASLCFKLDDDVFVTAMAKGNANARERATEEEFKIAVTASTHQRAAKELEELRKKYLPKNEASGPSFFILTRQSRRAQRAPLESQFLLNRNTLGLHYGEEFITWSDGFLNGLSQPGVSVLRGEPGTGKTYYLRHVMSALQETHRFYFIPVDNFDLLSSGNLADFWKKEQQAFPGAAKVLVLEDAETLLMERSRDNRSPVSSILNITDGLMNQYVKLHLICTLNCKVEDLDPALLRPGRLRFFHNFERIPLERAKRVAALHDVELTDKEGFTLAELFSPASFDQHTKGAKSKPRRVGFGGK